MAPPEARGRAGDRSALPAPPVAGTGKVPLRLTGPIVLGTLLNALNSSMIAVALIAIQRAFHAGASVTWLISGLYLATAVAQPTMGKLVDRFGARGIFELGLVLVGIASVGATVAPSLGWLIASRVLLGVGTSAAFPAGLAMIRAFAAAHPEVGSPSGGLGAISAASQVAVALGPPLGGVLVAVGGWRSIFWVNLPIVTVAFVLSRAWLPNVRPPAPEERIGLARDLDLAGIAVFTGALVLILLFLMSLGDAPRWPLLPAGAALTAGLVIWERRRTRPFIDVRMLTRNRPLTATYVRTAFTFLVFYCFFYGLPAWLEQGRHLSTATVGLLMLPIPVLGTLGTFVAVRISNRRGPRPLLVIGTAVLTAGAAMLLGLDASTPLLAVAGVAALLGLPNGFNNLGNQTAMYETSPPEQTGTASGIYRTFQYVGANLASALVALTLGARATDAGLHHLAAILIVVAAILFVVTVPARHLRALTPRPA